MRERAQRALYHAAQIATGSGVAISLATAHVAPECSRAENVHRGVLEIRNRNCTNIDIRDGPSLRTHVGDQKTWRARSVMGQDRSWYAAMQERATATGITESQGALWGRSAHNPLATKSRRPYEYRKAVRFLDDVGREGFGIFAASLRGRVGQSKFVFRSIKTLSLRERSIQRSSKLPRLDRRPLTLNWLKRIRVSDGKTRLTSTGHPSIDRHAAVSFVVAEGNRAFRGFWSDLSIIYHTKSFTNMGDRMYPVSYQPRIDACIRLSP